MDSSTRTARIEARITPEALSLVKRAAEMEGRSVSEFVVASASEAARQAIERDRILRLSIGEQERFASLLLDAPAPNDALRQARVRHETLFGTE